MTATTLASQSTATADIEAPASVTVIDSRLAVDRVAQSGTGHRPEPDDRVGSRRVTFGRILSAEWFKFRTVL